jgi:hypothetical protein
VQINILGAWSDRAQHLALAPGRQLELAEHAWHNLTKVMALATSPGSAPPALPALPEAAGEEKYSAAQT